MFLGIVFEAVGGETTCTVRVRGAYVTNVTPRTHKRYRRLASGALSSVAGALPFLEGFSFWQHEQS